MDSNDPGQLSRRDFVGITIAGSATLVSASAAEQQETRDVSTLQISLKINGQERKVAVDSRTTLLDLLRENLHLVGTKKGCDHGQCGACTVIVDGRRINSCLSLAAMNEGREVVTIEGMADGENLHPMQAAFVKCDGLQCGYCTPGQICSAVAMLDELKTGAPSAVTPDISRISAINLTDDEIRERMSGNICRCGAYPGIVAAIRSVNDGRAA